MFKIKTTVTCFLLPQDGVAAKAKFLQHLRDPHEMWIIAYSFTLSTMIDEIIANSQGGSPIHIYLDRSQSTGSAEMPEVEKLVAAGVEVTIGTSPSGTSYITHTKGFVCDDTPVPFCWEGSVNFSESGWLQVNTAMNFNNQTWRDQFIAQFDALRDFAWTNERSFQLLKTPPKGVTIGTPAPVAGTMPGTSTVATATATATATQAVEKKKPKKPKKAKTAKKTEKIKTNSKPEKKPKK